MDTQALLAYIDRIYGYAVNRTYTREEADDLSQEILLTALRRLPTLREEECLEPWLWETARRVTAAFRRQMGRQRAMFVYDCPEMPTTDSYPAEEEEIRGLVRTRIAGLSGSWRDVLVLYYYDGLSCKQIAQRLALPEGTVTWRLSEARKQLKKECADMNELRKTALHPVKLTIRITGEGNYNGTTIPFPYAFIEDALSQNLLYHCYREARTVEELSRLCGVPAYYVEDALQNLVRREALMELPGGRYRTGFLIHGAETDDYNRRAAALTQELTTPFVRQLRVLASETAEAVDPAGMEEDEWAALCAMLAAEALEAGHNPLPAPPIPRRYDGFRWSYVGHLTNGGGPFSFGCNRNMNCGVPAPRYAHTTYVFAGFADHRMMTADQLAIITALLAGGRPEDRETVAGMVEARYLRRTPEGGFLPAMPVFPLPLKQSFADRAESLLAPLIPALKTAVRRYAAGYKRLYPPCLEEEADRACARAFSGLFVNLVATAQEKGLLSRPSPGRLCQVLMEEPPDAG